MSLLSVVRDVCAVVGVQAPTAVFTSINSNRTMFEMVACANEMAQRIAYDTRDWTMLTTAQFMVGSASADSIPLPSNYKRMLLTSQVYKLSNPSVPLHFVSDLNEWTQSLLQQNQIHSEGAWTIFGGRMQFYPFLGYTDADGNPVGEVILFNYLDKNCIAIATGGVGDRFTADDDTFRLDERLLKLGMITEWKKNKGSPYAEDMGTYSDAIANVMGRDKPSPIILMGRGRQYAGHW